MANTQRPYFIFNGINTADMGVILDRYPPFSRAEERAEFVAIPGRQGEVTLLECDERIFKPYVVTVNCFLSKTANPDAVASWLTGEGTLIMGNRPNRVMQAQIINQMDYEEILRGRKFASFAVPFKVQPLKGAYPPEADVTGSGTLSLTNPGHAFARPLYTVTAVADDTDVVLTVGDPENGGATLTVSLPEGVTTFIYDADTRICTSEDGSVLLNASTTLGGSGAEGMYLPAGETTEITPTLGIASVTVTPRWRYLI